jgi:AcrR family transcriptional regulator
LEIEEKASSKRLSKAERRRQLLETAYEIIREEGTDALTLARVAEGAGVTKPIAYEHFGTRAGLLMAIYQDYDARVTAAMKAALKESGKRIEDVAQILSAAYVDCAVTAGPEQGQVMAALSGTEEMEGLLNDCRDAFIAECLEAFAPFTDLPPAQAHTVMVGIVGAAEALSQAAAAHRLNPEEATKTLANMMIASLSR